MAKQNPTRATARSSQSSPGRTRTAAPPSRPAPAARPQGGENTRLAGLQRGFRETIAELRRVQWPDRMTTRNLTLVVVGMSLFLALVLGGVDWGLGRLVEWLIGL